MGSEMCIRDRSQAVTEAVTPEIDASQGLRKDKGRKRRKGRSEDEEEEEEARLEEEEAAKRPRLEEEGAKKAATPPPAERSRRGRGQKLTSAEQPTKKSAQDKYVF